MSKSELQFCADFFLQLGATCCNVVQHGTTRCAIGEQRGEKVDLSLINDFLADFAAKLRLTG